MFVKVAPDDRQDIFVTHLIVIIQSVGQPFPLLSYFCGCVCDVVHGLYHHHNAIEWKHFPRYWPFVRGIHRSPVNSSHTKDSDAELRCFLGSVPWTNIWANNGDAGDLRRHHTHYDVIVMVFCQSRSPITGMWHHYLPRYPTDEWHITNVFSSVYYSVVVSQLYFFSLRRLWIFGCILLLYICFRVVSLGHMVSSLVGY